MREYFTTRAHICSTRSPRPASIPEGTPLATPVRIVRRLKESFGSDADL